MPYRVATNALSAVNGSYVREALLNGLSLEQSGITNPISLALLAPAILTRALRQSRRITTFPSWVCYPVRRFSEDLFPIQAWTRKPSTGAVVFSHH